MIRIALFSDVTGIHFKCETLSLESFQEMPKAVR